jgi:hypothetical protein
MQDGSETPETRTTIWYVGRNFTFTSAFAFASLFIEAPSPSNNSDAKNMRKALEEKFQNQELRSGMRISKPPADAPSPFNNPYLPRYEDASVTFLMELDEFGFAGTQYYYGDSSDGDAIQPSPTNEEYDSDATITDPEHVSDSGTEMNGVGNVKRPRGRPRKIVDGQEAQRPVNAEKSNLKGKAVDRKKYTSQPHYKGPPPFLLDPDRTDIYANTANAYRDENGVYRWVDEEDDVVSPPTKEAGGIKDHNEEEHEYVVPPVTPMPKPRMMVEPSLTPLIPTPIEPALTPFTSLHLAPMGPKIKLTVSQPARALAGGGPDKHDESWMFPSTDGGYDPFDLPQFGEITASKDSAIRSTARNTNGTDLNLDDPVLKKNTLNFNSSHKRARSPTPTTLPPDDPPFPLFDDMTISPNKNKFVRLNPGKSTRQTPQEYADERAELKRRIEERKRRDEDEMYEGLSKFKGYQRGWNGEHESQRQITLQKEEQARDQKRQVQLEKEKAAAAKAQQGTQRPRAKREKIDDKYLEDAMLEWQNREAIAQIGLEDHVKVKQEELHRTMMSRPMDMEAIIREAHETLRANKRSASRSPPNSRPPKSPQTQICRKSNTKCQSPMHNRSSSEEGKLKGHNLGKAFDPPMAKKRVANKPRAFGVSEQE